MTNDAWKSLGILNWPFITVTVTFSFLLMVLVLLSYKSGLYVLDSSFTLDIGI